MRDQPNERVKRYNPKQTEPGIQECEAGQLVNWDTYRRLREDYDALLKERDAAQKYAALCRVQFEKGSMAADAFQKQVMALEKERDELKAKLEQACDVIDAYTGVATESSRLRAERDILIKETCELRDIISNAGIQI